jgi:ribosomal protein S12 methylthiotransferase accessory factor YcaO
MQQQQKQETNITITEANQSLFTDRQCATTHKNQNLETVQVWRIKSLKFDLIQDASYKDATTKVFDITREPSYVILQLHLLSIY